MCIYYKYSFFLLRIEFHVARMPKLPAPRRRLSRPAGNIQRCNIFKHLLFPFASCSLAYRLPIYLH
jgi:hypothetical protein